MSAIFAERALLPEGWARNVRFEISADGVLAGIRPDANADGAERLGGAVLPGMPNLHSHAFQRAMAGLAEVAGNPNDSFWTWRELMYRMVARLSPEQIEVIACQLYIEMLKAGYTAVAEFHHVHHDLDGRSYADPRRTFLRISRAASAAGIGLTLPPVLTVTQASAASRPARASGASSMAARPTGTAPAPARAAGGGRPPPGPVLPLPARGDSAADRHGPRRRPRRPAGPHPYRRTAEGSRRLPGLERTPAVAMAARERRGRPALVPGPCDPRRPPPRWRRWRVAARWPACA